MRIAISCKRFGAQGGAETFLLNFVRCLRDEGHHVKVITARADAEMEGVKIVRLAVKGVRGPFRDLAIARASRTALQADDADVTFSDQRCWGAQVVRVGGGLHREYLKQYARTYRNRGRRALYRLSCAVSIRERLRLRIEDRLYGHPDLQRIITNSHMVRLEIGRHYPHVADKIRVVYNGVDTERFSPALSEQHRGRVRAELGVPPDALVGVFVGTGWRRKGLHTFVRALGLLAREALDSPVYGIVVGRGNRRKMEGLARRHGSQERLRFTGAAEPDVYYGAADLLVLPSYYDPCANVTLEGLACGLPALTAVSNGAHELLTPGRDGFCLADAADAAALAGFIAHFQDPRRLARAAEAARALALQHTLDRQYRELMDALTDVAGTKA